MYTKRRLIFLLVAAFFSPCLYGQEAKVAEPEYAGNVVYVDGTQATPLEKQKCSTKTKTAASLFIVGVGKVKANSVVTGPRSPVRVKGRDSLQFIVRVNDNSIDPFNVINVFPLESNPNKKTRLVEVASVGTLSESTESDIAFISFQAKKFGEKSYWITLQKQLAPGEYAITVEGSREVFNMFGVD